MRQITSFLRVVLREQQSSNSACCAGSKSFTPGIERRFSAFRRGGEPISASKALPGSASLPMFTSKNGSGGGRHVHCIGAAHRARVRRGDGACAGFTNEGDEK
nr:MAG: hypothetical protein DIU78_09230 [Pseudomonadota bacterium]